MLVGRGAFFICRNAANSEVIHSTKTNFLKMPTVEQLSSVSTLKVEVCSLICWHAHCISAAFIVTVGVKPAARANRDLCQLAWNGAQLFLLLHHATLQTVGSLWGQVSNPNTRRRRIKGHVYREAIFGNSPTLCCRIDMMIQIHNVWQITEVCFQRFYLRLSSSVLKSWN